MITPADIENKDFSRVKRGYDMEEVDDFLDLIIVDMEKLLRENRQLKEEVAKAQTHVDQHMSTETSVYETLEAAKSLMNDISASAERRAEILLKNAQTAQDEYKNLVFVTRNNRPTQQFIVQECMDVTTRRIQKEHPEFERFSPHCFRHTFATRAIENGMQPKSVQKLLGHGSLQLTMDLYCHVTDDTLFDEMRKMEAV